jgi:hypothetical protein
MKLTTFVVAALSGILFSSVVLADDDCDDPVAEWKPREVLQQQLERRGWHVQRIKVDDGCYEVRGIDQHGNKFKAKYAPASLRILKMETTFKKGGDPAIYPNQGQKTK